MLKKLVTTQLLNKLVDHFYYNSEEIYENLSFIDIGFSTRIYDGETYTMLDCKGMPDCSRINNIQNIEDIDDLILYEINRFANDLEENLRQEYDIQLYILGRSGGWWGVHQEDLSKFLEISKDSVYNYVSDHIKDVLYNIVERDVNNISIEQVLSDNQLVCRYNIDILVQYIVDDLYEKIEEENYFAELADTTKIVEILNYIKESIYKAEECFIDAFNKNNG